MARKKKPAKQDQAAEQVANSSEISNSSTPAVATLPPGYVPARKRDIEHIQAMRQRRNDLKAKQLEVEDAAANVKRLKAEAKEIALEIDRMITNGPDDPALFDKHDRAALKLGPHGEAEIDWEISPHADAATAESLAPNKGLNAPESNEWAAPLLRDVLKLDDDQDIYRATFTKVLNMLAKVEITTVGELESLRAEMGNDWPDRVPGLGKVGRDLITEELDKYLQRTRDAAEFAKAAPKSTAAEPTHFYPLDFDAKFDVVKWIDTAGDYGSKITPNKLKKFLDGTMLSVPTLGARWHCDEAGIHVESFRDLPVDAAANVITYAEACEIIKGVKPKVEVSPPVDAAALKLDVVRQIVARHKIEKALTAAGLKKLVGSTAGGGVGDSPAWKAIDDRITILGVKPDNSDDLPFEYAEAAKLLKEVLAAPIAEPATPEEHAPPLAENVIWADLLRHFVERWRIEGPLTTIALKQKLYPAAGKFRTFEWTNADDGIRVHTPDACEHMICYREAARFLKEFAPSEFYDPNAAEQAAATPQAEESAGHDDDDPRLRDVAVMIYEDPRLNFGTEFDAEELCEELAGKFGENAKLRWDAAPDALVVSTVGKGARKLTNPASASYGRIVELLREVIDAAYSNDDEPEETDDE